MVAYIPFTFPPSDLHNVVAEVLSRGPVFKVNLYRKAIDE